MTSFDRDRNDPRCGDALAAYVLGALRPAEADALRDHLAGCAVCRDELAALQGAADALPLAVPQLGVPAGLKRRVMADVRTQRPPSRQPARRRPRRPVLALAAGLAAAAALALGLVIASSGSSGGRTVRASVTAPGASAVLRESAGHATVTVSRLPQPPAGKIYEVWLRRGDAAPEPTDTLFGVTSSGAATVAVPGDLHGVSAVLVTPEPREGSLAPTHAPVIIVRL